MGEECVEGCVELNVEVSEVAGRVMGGTFSNSRIEDDGRDGLKGVKSS